MSDSAARGRGHLALSRHKLGSWNTLLELLPKDPNKNDDESAVILGLEQKDKDAHSNTFVSRLDEHFMGLYGLFPETDKFSAVVCDCGSIVKPQGFKNHLARNHSSSTNGGLRGSKSDSLYFSTYATTSSSSNNGSSSRTRDKDNNYSSSNSPASSTSSTPVKNPEDFSGILPNSSNVVVKHKHKHKSESKSSSSKYKSKSSTISHHSSDSQPGTEKQVPEFIVNATSTSLDSSTYTFSASKTTGSGATTVTSSSSSTSSSKSQSSSSKGRHRHSKHSKKGAEIYDPDKHCGVISHASSEEGGKPCVRSFSCKIHSVQQRREVQGRTRSFDTLLLEMGREPPPQEIISIDIESNSSSCSSVMEKQTEANETLRIKEQIELPTIVLRKLEHDVVQGIDNRAIAELLEKNAIVVKKEEPIELQVMDTSAQVDVQNADQMPPQELFELISQVEEAAESDQNILTMEQLTNLVEETNKNDMFQMGTTELHCRTIAFPLSVFYLMKNNMPTSTFVQPPLLEQPEMKFDSSTFQTLDASEQLGQYYDPTNNQIRFDLSSNDTNNANLQNFSAAMTKQPSHDLLSNILTLQELVPLVPDNYCDVYAKVCDQNLLSDCSSLFPMLTTVHDTDHHVSDKQQFETDYRAIKSCLYPNLPKPSAVNTFGLKRMGGGSTISRKALYLRKTLLVDSDKKFKLKTEGTNYATANVQSPHGMLLTSSAAVNKGRKRSFLASTAVAKQKASDHLLQNSFTNDTNKMEIDSNLDEILQPASKRQLFVSRY